MTRDDFEEIEMQTRYLVGPWRPERPAVLWPDMRSEGRWRTLGREGADVPLAERGDWSTLLAACPEGWQPDVLVLDLAGAVVPAWLWSVPVPIVGLASDWRSHWQWYRRCLPACDLVLSDPVGAALLTRAGLPDCRGVGLLRVGEEAETEPGTRDIDLLILGPGPFTSAEQGRRCSQLAERFRPGHPWRVRFVPNGASRPPLSLLRQARVVTTLSMPDAPAALADLARSAGACSVWPEADSWADQLGSVLADEPRRLELVSEAPREPGTGEMLDGVIEAMGDGLLARASRRVERGWQPSLGDRVWQCLGADEPHEDVGLVADLQAAGDGAEWHNALGVVRSRLEARQGPLRASTAATVWDHFRTAARGSDHIVAGLNLVEVLVALDERDEAVREARRLLTVLDRGEGTGWDWGHFPPLFDRFRREWERAGWANAGDAAAERAAQRDLARWKLHLLLSDLTDDLPHFYEAVLARPDLPTSRAALGCALARAGRLVEARPHLQAALDADVFDLAAARALGQLLDDLGGVEEARRWRRSRAVLSAICPEVVPAEAWFAGHEPCRVSVVIPCHGQSAATRVCLESVLRHTREPFEIVVIDNASPDDTPAMLEEFRSRSGPSRFEVIRNENNLGFAAAVNQGLAVVQGEWVVLLNNDTCVTEGWLEGMLAAAETGEGEKRVGLVGPVSNAAPEPQFVPAGYRDLSGLDAFAAEHARKADGRVLEVERLTGFCLMARRETLARVGMLDEQFGVGFFEEDLCVRVKRAGWGLRVAASVFVHHEGSRTFRALGVDTETLLRDNFQRFHDKWGSDESSRYRMPDGSRPRREAGRPTVSLCVIARNEEHNIGECLTGWAEMVDEIVVVDTGSADRTRELAESAGAKVSLFPWVDSFAAARNASLDAATSEYVFWMDADDRMDDANRERLKSLLATLDGSNAAYVVKCRCVAAEPGGTETVVDHVRLFRRDAAHRWRYRIHEQILPALRGTDADVRFSDVEVRHVGYVDPALRGRKLQRDLRLLEMENGEHPDDPFTLFNLGQVYQELRRPDEALRCLQRSLDRSHPRDSIVRKLYSLIASCLTQMDRPDEALRACRDGREHYPDDAELLFREGLLLGGAGRMGEAIAVLTRLVEGTEGDHFASVAGGLRGHLGRHHLAELFLREGRLAEAETHWRQALLDEEAYLPAWLGLGEVYLARQDWHALDGVIERLRSRSELEAETLRGRAQFARKEFAAARWTLSQLAEAHPDALWPRVFLSHVLLQEGRDWRAAERALLDVLRLDPHNAQARRNLDLLRREHGVGT